MNSNDDEFDEASKGIQPNNDPVLSLGPYSEPAYGRWDPAHERKVFADKTRRRLAYLIIGVVLLLDVALVAAFIGSAFNGGNFSKEDFSQVIANLAGPNALAAAVIGFYYGKTSDSD